MQRLLILKVLQFSMPENYMDNAARPDWCLHIRHRKNISPLSVFIVSEPLSAFVHPQLKLSNSLEVIRFSF